MFFGVEDSKSPLLVDDVTILIDPLLEVERLLHFALHVQLERCFIRNSSFEFTCIITQCTREVTAACQQVNELCMIHLG